MPWEKFGASAGVFLANVDSNIRIIIPTGTTVDTFGFRLEADGEDYPGIDLKGNVEFNYTGLQLYLRVFF